MGKKDASDARQLFESAKYAFRHGTIGGISKLQDQLRALEGEVGSVRAEREHLASCIRVCTSATLEFQKIAEDEDVCPLDVEDAAHDFNDQCRAALFAAARRIPISAARKKIDDACATLDEIKTTAVTWKEHSELRGARCRVNGRWVLFDGEEMKNRRAARRERYALTKDVPNERGAFLATTKGQNEALAHRRERENQWTTLRDEAARAAAMLAFSAASLERQPRNIAWRLVEGSTVEFKVQTRPMPPDELNPWSTNLKAVIKREQRFYDEAQRFYERAPDHNDAVSFDLTKRLAEAPTTPAPTTPQPTSQPSTAAPSLAGSRAPTTAYPTATPTTPAPSATPTPRPTPMPTTATPTSSATTQGLFALKLVVDYGDLTAADGDVLCQAVLASLELAAGTDCEQVTFEPVSGRRRLQTTGYVVTIVLEATYHPSSEDDISSRLVGQLQDSLGDGSFTAALETAAAGTDSSLASLSYADLESGVLVDETNQILDEALAADPGQALVFTWTPTPKPTLTRRPTPSPTQAPIQSAPPTSVADYQASKASGGASADAAGTDAVIGSLIAVIFVVMVGYAGFQHHRQKQLEQEEKEGIEAGHFEGDEADPDFACEDVDPAKAVPIDDVEAPTEDDSRSFKSSEAMDSDVFFHQLMEQTAQASELASLPEGSAFEPSVVASEVGDDEWDAMLNDVDDEESTETWNEDLASTLLFKLAQGDCEEGFATRDRLAQALRERPDLLDMLGIMGISGDEIEFFLETIESDGDVVSRSQFLRVLERWRKSDTHSDSGTVSSKGLADLPPPAPPPRKMQPPAHPPPPGPPTPAGPVVDDDAASSATGPDVASRLFPPASPESAQEAAPLDPLDSEDAELAKLAAMDARFAPPAPALPARPADADGGEAPPPGDDDDDEAPPPGDDDEDEDEAPPPDDDDDEAEPPPAGPGGAPFSPDMSLLQFTRRRRSAILAPGRRPPPPPAARGAWSPSALFRPPSPDNLVAPAYKGFRRARDNSPSDASPSPK